MLAFIFYTSRSGQQSFLLLHILNVFSCALLNITSYISHTIKYSNKFLLLKFAYFMYTVVETAMTNCLRSSVK